MLDVEALMLLPGGPRLEGRDEILASMTAPPWSSHELEDVRVVAPATDVGVAYGVVARRDKSAPYSALVGSTYVRRRAGWNLLVHQQTPRD